MPDWTYQTVFGPLLRRLPPRVARNLALGSLGTLASLPLGARIIRFMGHMQPDPRLRVAAGGIQASSPVGLGCRLDPLGSATRAFSQFGFGYLVLGPVITRPAAVPGRLHRDDVNECLVFERPLEAVAPATLLERLRQVSPRQPVLAQVEPTSVEDAREIHAILGQHVQGFLVGLEHLDDWCSASRDAAGGDGPAGTECLPVWLIVNPAQCRAESTLEAVSRRSASGFIQAVVVQDVVEESGGDSIAEGQLRVGKPSLPAAVGAVRRLRERLGAEVAVVGAAGVHAPGDAVQYFDAGADLVQLDSGLVFGGPGLPKRINEVVLQRQRTGEAMPAPEEAGNGGVAASAGSAFAVSAGSSTSRSTSLLSFAVDAHLHRLLPGLLPFRRRRGGN